MITNNSKQGKHTIPQAEEGIHAEKLDSSIDFSNTFLRRYNVEDDLLN